VEDNCCGHEHIQSLQDVLEEVLSIHVANCCCWQLIQPRSLTAVACVSLSGYLRKADTNYSLQFQVYFFSQKVQGTNRCWVDRVQSSPCFISAATANIWIRHGLLHVHWRLLSEFKSVCAPNTTQTLLQAHSIKICCMTRYGPHLDLGVLFETFLDVLFIQRNTNMNDLRLRSVVCAL